MGPLIALSRVDVEEGGCWRWHGLRGKGTGSVTVDGRKIAVHRLLYAVLVGPPDNGWHRVLIATCGNAWCCNPQHRTPASKAVAALRGGGACGVNARKLTCAKDRTEDPLPRPACICLFLLRSRGASLADAQLSTDFPERPKSRADS